jgi:hypothetical protein
MPTWKIIEIIIAKELHSKGDLVLHGTKRKSGLFFVLSLVAEQDHTLLHDIIVF